MSSWSVVDRSIIRFHLDFEFEVMNSILSLTLNPTILNIICWNDGLIWCSNYYLDTWWIKQWDMTVAWLFGFRKFQTVLPNWRKGRHFTLRCLFIQSFQTFLDVKIDTNQVNLTHCRSLSLIKNVPRWC